MGAVSKSMFLIQEDIVIVMVYIPQKDQNFTMKIILIPTGVRFVTNFASYNMMLYIRQGVQLYTIPNTTSPHLSVIFTFSATGMKMTMVLSYSAVICLSTGI